MISILAVGTNLKYRMSPAVVTLMTWSVSSARLAYEMVKVFVTEPVYPAFSIPVTMALPVPTLMLFSYFTV